MTQTSSTKKPASTPKLAATKLAADATQKAAHTTLAAVESTRASAENAVKIGSKAVKEFMASSTEEAQKAQEKVFAITREGAEHFSKSADAVTKALAEAVELSRDNVEAFIESANLSATLAQDVSAELVNNANKAFSEHVELSKDLFAARTISDLFDIQNRVIKSTIDHFFNQAVKVSGLVFEYSNEALEPINERFAQSAEHLTKTLSGHNRKAN